MGEARTARLSEMDKKATQLRGGKRATDSWGHEYAKHFSCCPDHGRTKWLLLPRFGMYLRLLHALAVRVIAERGSPISPLESDCLNVVVHLLGNPPCALAVSSLR